MIMLMVKFLKGVIPRQAFTKFLPLNPSIQVVRRPHTFDFPATRNNILSNSPHIQCAIAFNTYRHVINLNDSLTVIKIKLKSHFKTLNIPRVD